jgi:carbamoyl-phosphate synthase large subunit
VSTGGTKRHLEANGVPVRHVHKINEGRPNVVDMIKNSELQLIVNTPSGMVPRQNENVIRSEAIKHRVLILTTLSAARAAASALQSLRRKDLDVEPLQHYRARLRTRHGG